MEQFEFTRAKIAKERRSRLAMGLRASLIGLVVLCALTVALQGGIAPAIERAAEVWSLLLEGNLQALLERWVIGVICLFLALLLAVPALAGAWAGAKFVQRAK